MADRYWVGGTGTWDATTTTNWAATSGGAGGESVPVAADAVIFDASSGTSFTVTLDSGYNPTVTSVTGGSATVTLDFNNQILTCSTFSFTGTAVRTLAFGTGNITITGNGTTVWNGATSTGFSYTGTGGVNFTYAGSTGTRTITHGTTGGSEATKAPPFNITAGTDTITITGTSYLSDVNFTGFGGTVTSAARFIYGNLTVGTSTTFAAGVATTTFAGTSGTKIITTNGKTLAFPIVFGGVGSTFQLADNYTGGTATAAQGNMTLTGGTLDLNGNTLTIFSYISSGTAVRGITANGGQINLTGNAATVWGGNIITNVTIIGLTINLTYSGATGTRNLAFSVPTEATAISVNVTAGTDTISFTGSVNNLNFTGFTGTFAGTSRTVYGSLTLNPGMTVGATVNATAFSGTNSLKTITTNGVLWNTSMTFGTFSNYQLQDDLDLATGALTGTTLSMVGGTLDINGKTVTTLAVSTNSASVRVLAFGTNGTINITGSGITVWQAATASNFSYTGTGRVNFTYSGSTGTRTISHGSSSGSSASTKAPPFFITAGTDIIATTANGAFTSLDFTGFTGTLTNTTRNMYGNLTLGTGMTATGGANATTFASTTSVMTLISNGVTTDFSIGMSGVGGTFQLTEPLVISARTLSLTSGTIDCNDFDATVGLFSSSGGLPRTLDISNTTFTLAGTGVVWNTLNASSLTATVSNSTVLLSDDTTATKTVRLGTLPALDNIVIGGNTSTANTILLSDANTVINSITSTKTVAQTIGLNGSLTVNSWGIVGTATAPVTLADNGTATVANLHYAGTGTVNVDYYTISYSAATPPNTWYALTSNNNVNAGNNSGWIFGDTPVSPSTFFLVF
jgi:hypothetical protein